VARGYLNRPELAAEKFVPDPFSGDEPGARLYKTGDRVRRRADGDIEFLGRLDGQVKLRGFRVEPGEVEGVLNGHHAVRESVVVLREDAPGKKRLVAYVVPSQDATTPSVDELRGFLREKLPEYMVPSSFVTLDTLPLTPNGKVDRQALLASGVERPDSGSDYAAPRDALEERLARIWGEVLGIGRVGIHDDFFELGGHSLLATQLISQVRAALGVELPLRSLFEKPTVAGLAVVVRSHGEQKDDGVDPIERIGWSKEEHLLAQLDQLSDEEVASLLSSMLAEEDTAE
jgi:acyl carrier protein